MRVLVTGSAGHIGREQVRLLREAGHEVRSFDRVAQGRDCDWEHSIGDLRDILAVRRAVQGMDAVAHLGAIPTDRRGADDDVLTINVQGTWNVLLACMEAEVGRVVAFSSVNALGCVGGRYAAEYLPIDDAHPRHPLTPYQLSKHLGEEVCRSFTERYGMVTICLRPVYVTAPDHYHPWQERDPVNRAEWGKTQYWAYVDVRDVCAATLLSLAVDNVQHDAFLLTADDTTLETPTAQLVNTFYPDTPWPNIERAVYLADTPHRSLMDCTHAKQKLGWQPQHSWRSLHS